MQHIRTLILGTLCCALVGCHRQGRMYPEGFKNIDNRLKLDDDLPALILSGRWANVYGSPNLYDADSADGDSFPVQGTNATGTCNTTLHLQPAASSGAMKRGDINGSEHGIVIARLTSDDASCVPNGVYKALGTYGIAGLVAIKGGGSNSFGAWLVGFGPAAVAVPMTFEYCNHGKTGDSDKAKHGTVSANSTACDEAKQSKYSRTDDAAHGPHVPGKLGLFADREMLWIACSDDCCPATGSPS